MADATPTSGTPSSNRTIMIVLAYLGPLALIPLLVEKDDKEVQWHARHGLVLLIAEIIVGVVTSLIAMIPLVGCVAIILFFALWAGIMILHIMCIIKGVKGERLLVPGISEYADRL
jgi:uncharacterized membrane protein